MLEHATVLERDAHGIKVVETPAQEIIKIFRLKRQISSARFRPYAVRFAQNAKRLSELGIPTVEVKKLAYCPEQQRHVLVYQKLPGQLLRDALQDPDQAQHLVQLFGAFVARLHALGVYFRSLHFKNVLVLENGELALIDISDMSFKRFKLRTALRLRNFSHMLRYAEDKQLLLPHLDQFLQNYLQQAHLSNRSAKHIQLGLEALVNQD